MLPIHTILHPTDFSESAGHALELACVLARESGARLILLHVAAPLEAVSEASLVPVLRESQAELKDRLRRLAARYANLRVEHRLERGDAGAVILRVAQDEQADLVTMGTHGRTGLGRLLTGSVAEQVVRAAPCPVLTVKVPTPGARTPPEPPDGEPG